MSVTSMMSMPAVIYRRSEGPAKDDYGNLAVSESVGEPVLCQVTQRTTRELTENTITTIDSWRLFLPISAAFGAGDRIEIAGLGTMEAEGEPWPVWHPPSRSFHHLEATLRRVG